MECFHKFLILFVFLEDSKLQSHGLWWKRWGIFSRMCSKFRFQRRVSYNLCMKKVVWTLTILVFNIIYCEWDLEIRCFEILFWIVEKVCVRLCVQFIIDIICLKLRTRICWSNWKKIKQQIRLVVKANYISICFVIDLLFQKKKWAKSR